MLFVFYYVSLDVFASGVWAEYSFAGLRDPSLREFASRSQSTVIASRATGTTDAYRRAFLRWRGFAASSDEIQAFPAKTEHVAPVPSACPGYDQVSFFGGFCNLRYSMGSQFG